MLNAAVTVSGLQVLSTTWKSTNGTASHCKYIIDNANVYRDGYRVTSVNRIGRVVSDLPDNREQSRSLPTSRYRSEAQTRRMLRSTVLMTSSIRPDSTCLARLKVKPFAVWKGTCDGKDSASGSTTASTTTGPFL
jgi:hypothetical protein